MDMVFHLAVIMALLWYVAISWAEMILTILAKGTILLKPSSSGTVELRTNSVYDAPLIDPKYV